MPNLLLEQSPCYRPLDAAKKEIRILCLLDKHYVNRAGNRQQFCTFEYLCLDDALESGNDVDAYDAISWCWGEITYNAAIYVDGYGLHIPENALEVIESMCLPQRKLRIWIDAVCINQQDVDERSQQVALMQEIYTKAREVLIWLGCELPCTKSAVKSLQKIFQQCHDSTDNLTMPIPYIEQTYDPLPRDIDWHAMGELLSEPWFGRLWCFQEAVLAKKAVCYQGVYHILWRDLITACHWMYHRKYRRAEYAGPRGLPNLQKLKEIHAVPPDTWGLSRLIGSTSGSEWLTTDPRDKVYAVLGLARSSTDLDPSIRELTTPNYRQSVARVFADATRASIMESRELGPLARCNLYHPAPGQEPDTTDFPSWVPAYHFRGQLLCSGVSSNGEIGLNAGLSGLGLDRDTEWNVLRLQGLVIDEIAKITEPLSPSLSADDIARFLSEYWALALNFLRPQASRSNLATALRTMIMMLDRMDVMMVNRSLSEPITSLAVDDAQAAADFQAFVQKYWPAGQIPPPKESDARIGEKKGDYSEVATDIDRMCFNRRFFVSKSGELGMAPPSGQVGDTICILWSGRAPFLLRRQGEHWRYIGETYLELAMSGEYVEALNRHGKLEEETRWFAIV